MHMSVKRFKRIMMVDDSPSVRQMVSLTLQAAGYEVVEAADGREALEKFEAAAADMLITDLNMPRMDGFELVRELRQDPANRFLPIVMLTTEAEGSKRDLGRSLGASGWIVKPFKPDQLLKVVRLVLN